MVGRIDAEKAFSEPFVKAGGKVENVRVPVRNPDFAPFLQRAADEKPDAPLQPYYDLLEAREMPLPVFSIDARRHDHIIMMLEALLETTR